MCRRGLRLVAPPSTGYCAQGAAGANLRTLITLRDAPGPTLPFVAGEASFRFQPIAGVCVRRNIGST